MSLRNAVAEAGKLPTDVLLAAAKTEMVQAGQDDPVPHLVALHRRATREVFDAAARLMSSVDGAERELGVLVFRELGDPDEEGRRPFSGEAVPLLEVMLAEERDPRVLAGVVSALGYNAATNSLKEVVRLAKHPHWLVRFHVAAALPSLVNPDRIQPNAADALLRLCRDPERDIRYYALYALLEEVAGVEPEHLNNALADLRDDPDEQIRSMARSRRADA